MIFVSHIIRYQTIFIAQKFFTFSCVNDDYKQFCPYSSKENSLILASIPSR